MKTTRFEMNKKAYKLENIKTGEIIEVFGNDKNEACKNAGIKVHNYKVKAVFYKDCGKEFPCFRCMTKRELIEILSQGDLDEEVNIVLDEGGYNYNINDDELIYDIETKQLVMGYPEPTTGWYD
jgi:hypothetical protein